jgi:hypothetical protein
LDDGARALLKQPVSIIFGSVDEMNTPDATRASGAAVLDDGRLRVLIPADATASRANAVQGARVSVLVTDVNTYQSVQWKGLVLQGPTPRAAGDIAVTHDYLTRFRRGLEANGMSPEQLHHLCSLDTVSVEIDVDEQYDQTPGLDAGRKVSG